MLKLRHVSDEVERLRAAIEMLALLRGEAKGVAVFEGELPPEIVAEIDDTFGDGIDKP